MKNGEALAMEMAQEATITKRLLERVPDDKFDWQPHERSMSLGRLASHVVETYQWTEAIITRDVLDFAEMDYKPEDAKSGKDLLEKLETVVGESVEILNNVSDEAIMNIWTMKDGDKVYLEAPKAIVLRSFVMNHMIHHRGQLSVYIRLLDEPVSQIYGPSADEPDM